HLMLRFPGVRGTFCPQDAQKVPLIPPNVRTRRPSCRELGHEVPLLPRYGGSAGGTDAVVALGEVRRWGKSWRCGEVRRCREAVALPGSRGAAGKRSAHQKIRREGCLRVRYAEFAGPAVGQREQAPDPAGDRI